MNALLVIKIVHTVVWAIVAGAALVGEMEQAGLHAILVGAWLVALFRWAR